MKKSKKLIAFLLSGAMCASLAFGAACGSGSNNDGDNTDPTDPTTPTEEVVDNTTEKGANSTAKSKYVSAIETTLKDVLTSTTGYEIVASFDYSLTEGTSTEKYAGDATVKTVNASTGYSADLDINYSVKSGSETQYGYMTASMRDTYTIYFSDDIYSDTTITSAEKAAVYYEKLSLDPETTTDGATIAFDVDDLFDYAAGTYTAAADGIDLGAIADLALAAIESPLCGVYGTITDSTLTFDLLKEIEYIAACTKTLSSALTSTMTISDLANNATVKALVDLYLGSLTAADIETALTLAASMGYTIVETLPTSTSSQSAYDYLIAVLNQALTEYEDLADSTIASITGTDSITELQSTINDTVDQIVDILGDYSSFVITLTLSGSTLSSMTYSYGYATTQDGTAIAQTLSASITFAEKSVTLATIDPSKVIVDYYVAYNENGTSCDAYLMEDGKLALELADGVYTATGIAYTLDTNGNIATIGGSSTKTLKVYNYGNYAIYGIEFTYNNTTYIIGDYYGRNTILTAPASSDDEETTTEINYNIYRRYNDGTGNYDLFLVKVVADSTGATETTYTLVGTGEVNYSTMQNGDTITISDGSVITVYGLYFRYTVDSVTYQGDINN